MNISTLKTPILFLVFNRPDTTAKVFERIRAVRPLELFIAADGPRSGRADDIEKCSAVKKIVAGVDWPCSVSTLYREKNLGCGRAVSSAIEWFFEKNEAGIILEDDCLPDLSFFKYTSELLEKYKNDERIGIICGANFQFGERRGEAGYYFSRYPHIWGWASWRRVWCGYDYNMKNWENVKNGGWLMDYFGDASRCKYWSSVFDAVREGKINTWDYQLFLTFIVNNYMSIIPAVNLISNLGYCCEATHTAGGGGALSEIKTLPLNFPLIHPEFMIRDAAADKRTEKLFFKSHGTFELIKHNIKVSIKKMLKIKK